MEYSTLIYISMSTLFWQSRNKYMEIVTYHIQYRKISTNTLIYLAQTNFFAALHKNQMNLKLFYIAKKHWYFNLQA